jgi:hypothetical protein
VQVFFEDLLVAFEGVEEGFVIELVGITGHDFNWLFG